MAAQVEVQPAEVGRAVAGGRLHLNPLTDSSNTNLIEIPVINQARIIASEPNKPVPAPKPRLSAKPFSLERNPTIKPILAPKPQTKPRPESTRLPGHKPEPPSSPKPLQPLASGKPTLLLSNPNRPASTSFKTNKFNTGQTTKPIAQPFKPAPPFDPGVTSKPSPPVLAEIRKPAASSYAKNLKNLQAAEWFGTTQRENEKSQGAQIKGGTSITRAKSLGVLLDVGLEVEKKAQPEAPVQLRAHSRGSRARPVSAIFPDSPAKTETPALTPRWVGRRPLSADLTSKFESVGLSLHRKSLKADTQGNTTEEKSPPLKREQDSVSPQRSNAASNAALTDQSINKVDETAVKETDDDDDERGVSIKSRISLLFDLSSTPAPTSQGSDVPSPVQPAPEAESTLGVKKLIKQLTEDTTPTQSPVIKPTPKPRPLPLDLTKRFSSERSPDLVPLSEAADHHEIIKDPQRRAEESVITPIDQRTFLDSKDSQEQLRKASTPEEPGSSPVAAVQTVRASLFENVVERHSVFMMDDVDSHSSPSSKRRDLEDDGSLFIATYKEPVSPSSPQQVRHAFDTVQAIEKNRVVSELIPSAQWEDKAMTLRSKRSDGSRSVAEGTHPAQGQSASSMTAESQPRYLRVGALPKWDNSDQDQNTGLEKGMLKESQREGKERPLEQDDTAAAPKRLKMLPTDEQSKPRATYFALTGQIQEPFFLGEAGTSIKDIDDHSARSALGYLPGKNLPMRRNPSLEEAYGKAYQSQEKVEELMMRSNLSSRELIELEKQRLKEKKEKEAADKIRQVARDQEILWVRESQKGRQREVDLRSVFDDQRKEEMLDAQKKRELQKETEIHMAKLKELEKEKQRQMEMEKQAHREFAQMKELEMQREAERHRQKVYEKQKRESEEKQRDLEMQKQIELEKQRLQEAKREKLKELERERLRQREREKRHEAERMQERERQKQREEERQRELDKERRLLEIQKEKQRMEEMERLEEERQQHLEFQKQKQKEKERQKVIELEKQRVRDKKEREWAEKMKQMALEQEMLRMRELDKEREQQKEMEKERQKEIEREKQRQEQERQFVELQKQKQQEKERQQFMELEKQRLREREEPEKIKQMALEQEMLRIRELDKERERQKEMEREHQKEIEKEKQRVLEQQRQRDLERERQRLPDLERQEMENQRLRQRELEEKKRIEELERFKEKEIQQILEFEKQRLREKMEKDNAEKMRQIAKQQEAERQRLKEKQRKEEHERLRRESSPMRPKVLDLDSVLRNEPSVKATAQRSDPANRWKDPYKPGILDIDSFTPQTQHSPARDLFAVSGIQGLESDFGARLQHTPEREASWKVPTQTSGSFSSPVWTTTPQDPWELRPVEMSVDNPAADQRKHANKQSIRQDEQSRNPQRNWPTVQDEPLNLAPFSGTEARTANTPSGLSSSSSTELIWLPRELQPQESRGSIHNQRRSQGSQELNRMRSRSVSRRSAPAASSADGNLSRVRSRSAHREQDRHSWVPQTQGGDEEGKDCETPVRDTDSQYGTWETGLRTDDSLTPATPSSESNLSPSPKKPSTPLTPGNATSQSEADTPDGVSSENQPLAFPDTPTALLDTSVFRSRAQLGKKRAPRTRPTRATRQKEEEPAEDWLYRDSTEPKPERKEDDSDSEEQARGAEASLAIASQPQRVALFPGMDPSALKAQLKKRGDSDNQVDGAAAASPSQLSRSPKSPFLPRATRVLPPAGGKENGEEDSPQWLKELKSKKRLSQYESES